MNEAKSAFPRRSTRSRRCRRDESASWLRAAPSTSTRHQRAILFWHTLRQRGNHFIEHTSAEGLKPVLHFEYETVLDGRAVRTPGQLRAAAHHAARQASRWTAYARPYLIIDPRAGHGPGIGGFKDDSQVGVALRAGHPVYFVIFFRDPEARPDACSTCALPSSSSSGRSRALHPDSPRSPRIVGNCQGGWAAMMLAAVRPRRHRPDRHQRRADVLLERRVERRRGR